MAEYNRVQLVRVPGYRVIIDNEIAIQWARTESYTECPRRNVPDFGRVFLMLKYTDITQNTYVQS
jgi:hypothetical protein